MERRGSTNSPIILPSIKLMLSAELEARKPMESYLDSIDAFECACPKDNHGSRNLRTLHSYEERTIL